MRSDVADPQREVRPAPKGRRLRRLAALLLAPLVFGLLLDVIQAVAHLIDVAQGDRWKRLWTDDLPFLPVMAYVGSALPATVVMITLFLTGWRTDARKVMGIFTLVCVVMIEVWGPGGELSKHGLSFALVPMSLAAAGFICIPGLAISGLYCWIAGVPWRAAKLA